MRAPWGKWEVEFKNKKEFERLKKEMWTEGNYYVELSEEEEERWVRERVVIVDVGAHLGLASLYWLNFYPRARVVAIEANAELAKMLERNVAENNLAGQVEMINVAVGERAGKRGFFVDAEASEEGKWLMTGSFYAGNGGEMKEKKVMVEVRRLSEIIEEVLKKTDTAAISARQKIDLLKIDIEGAEYGVIREMIKNGGLQKVGRIVMEVHEGKSGTHEEMKKMLERGGWEEVSWRSEGKLAVGEWRR